MNDVSSHESRISRNEARIIAMSDMLKEQLSAINKRLDDFVVTQINEHTRHLKQIDASISEIHKTIAADHAHRAGSKAALMGIVALASGLSGIIGTLVMRLM